MLMEISRIGNILVTVKVTIRVVNADRKRQSFSMPGRYNRTHVTFKCLEDLQYYKNTL